MNVIEDLINRENERHSKLISLLELLPKDWEFVVSVEGNQIYCGTQNTLEDVNAILHRMREADN